MIWLRTIRPIVTGMLASMVVASGMMAQGGTASVGPTSAPTTRADLTARLHAADSLGRKEEAFLLRTRLQNGDFEIGDRIAINYQVQGFKTGTDTAVVQEGRIIRLPEPLGEINLSGMLRQEIPDTIVARVNKYYKIATVRVTVLLRLQISGAVRSAGYYYVAPDLPLSDLIMKTGGQDQLANLRDVIIRRGDQIVWNKQDVESALGDNVTLERLNLEPGDEIVVGAKHPNQWLTIMQVGFGLLGVVVSLYALFRR